MMLEYTCGICNRKTWRGGKTLTMQEMKCKKCGIYICPTCYKEYVKNDVCPKCGGKVYAPLF